jgi:H+/Na+-translocating ferredoxin:NAD+ oxidoreductase subunit G
MINKSVLLSAAVLGAFSVIGVTLVAATYQVTSPLIAHNQRRSLLEKLEVVVPPSTVDNDMVSDHTEVHDRALLGADTTIVYRGRKHGRPVAAIFRTVVPDGYGGPINLLVAVRYDGTLGGVRVLSHKETPGLGDRIEERKSDWILGFTGKSLGDPPLSKWGVKRDGGDFDQFTGATITPRAVIKAVKNTLLFVQQHRDTLYSTPQATTAVAQAKG